MGRQKRHPQSFCIAIGGAGERTSQRDSPKTSYQVFHHEIFSAR